MKLHANARTCPKSRHLLVDQIERARRWLARWRAEGSAGLADRSSAPGASRTRPGPIGRQRSASCAAAGRVDRIAELAGVGA